MLQQQSETKQTAPNAARYAFADMHLQPGDRLQIHCLSHPGRPQHIIRMVGFAHNIGLLVTLPLPRHGQPRFLENEIVVIRAFSRNNAYAFKCSINRICRTPFAYMHLSFPENIHGAVVRKSARVKAALDAAVTPPGENDAHAALVENLSATGALLCATEAIVEKQQNIRLSFDVTVHDVTAQLTLDAVVLSAHQDNGQHRYGVEFGDMPAHERMILRSLIYQQMIDNPRSLT